MSTREKDSYSVERLIAQWRELRATKREEAYEAEAKNMLVTAAGLLHEADQLGECADQLAALQIPQEKVLEDTRRFLTFIASGTEINSDDADTAIELARGIEQLRARLAVPQEPPREP